jgi:acyl-CoA synthetase (NDP forming)
VLRACTLDQLIDTGLVFERQPAPLGRRIALVGNGGGPLILGADAAEAAGLAVPELSPALQDQIGRLAPRVASAANPVDLSATMTADALAAVVGAVAASGEVDAVVVVCVEVENRSLEQSASRLDSLEHGDIPMVMSLIGSLDANGGAVPRFPTPERAVNAVALAAGRAEWLATHAELEDGGPAPTDATSLLLARRIARRGLAQASGWLEPAASFELLEAAAIPLVRWRHVQSAAECGRACDAVGAPCVVKADVGGLLHKFDEGAVVLGVASAEDARDVYRRLEAQFGERLRGAIVQAQVPTGVELLIGVTRDARFGPILVVGAGGVETELRDDRTLLVAPVSTADAARAVEGLRVAPLFHGFRARPELPVAAVSELVHRVGMLVAAVPELQQLDLNPVIVGPEGCVAVDALVAVAEPPAPVTPARGLRRYRL